MLSRPDELKSALKRALDLLTAIEPDVGFILVAVDSDPNDDTSSHISTMDNLEPDVVFQILGICLEDADFVATASHFTERVH